jgi:hypothetical protein
MQQTGKRKFARRLKTTPSFVQPPTLSSLSLVHRFGKVEIIKIERQAPKDSHLYFRLPEMPGWCMPPIPVGYIKCRGFDFL